MMRDGRDGAGGGLRGADEDAAYRTSPVQRLPAVEAGAAHGAYCSDVSHLPGYTMLDFSDTHHLDQAGATKFTTWLVSTIVAPILTGAIYVSNY